MKRVLIGSRKYTEDGSTSFLQTCPLGAACAPGSEPMSSIYIFGQKNSHCSSLFTRGRRGDQRSPLSPKTPRFARREIVHTAREYRHAISDFPRSLPRFSGPGTQRAFFKPSRSITLCFFISNLSASPCDYDAVVLLSTSYPSEISFFRSSVGRSCHPVRGSCGRIEKVRIAPPFFFLFP